MDSGLSEGQIIDLSIDVQNYIRQAKKSKLFGFHCQDNPCFASQLDVEVISEIEIVAGSKIEDFEKNWHQLITSISESKKCNTQKKVFLLESIANNASRLAGLT